MNYSDEFNKKMLLQTDDFAKMSKDRSTKVGASLLKPNQRHSGNWGYNGMVRGANDDLLVRHDRPEKYLWTEHAERNLIFNEARKYLSGKIIFCSRFPSIVEARAIASVGISKIITVYPENYKDEYEYYVSKVDIHKLNVDDNVKNYARVIQIIKENGIELIFPLGTDESYEQCGIGMTAETLSKMPKYQDYLNVCKGYSKRWSAKYVKESSAALILDPNGYSPISWGLTDIPARFLAVATDEDLSNPQNYIPSACSAIYSVVKPIFEGSTLYASWCPCFDCSMAISEVGVKKVVSKQPDFSRPDDLRWKTFFELSIEFYKKIGMEYKLYSYEDLDKEREKENS